MDYKQQMFLHHGNSYIEKAKVATALITNNTSVYWNSYTQAVPDKTWNCHYSLINIYIYIYISSPNTDHSKGHKSASTW